MRSTRICLTAAMLAAILLLAANPAAAVNASVTSQATFTNPTGPGASTALRCGPGGPTCPFSPPSQIRWGDTSFSTRSGLGFTGVTNRMVTGSEQIAVGTLTHFNNATAAGTSIEGVMLNVSVTLATGGGSLVISVPVELEIDETSNQTPCTYPSATPCADAINIVSLGENLSSSEVIGDTGFTLTIDGFLRNGEIVTQFVSDENRTNSVQLFATIAQNARPVADAGADQTVEQNGALTPVTLDGTASTDADGDALTYSWSGPGLEAEVDGATPTVELPPGTHEITLTVSDGELTAADTVQVVVQDTTAPTITGARTPAANAHGWNNTDVTVTFECEDAGSGIASCSGDVTYDSEVVDQSVTGTAVDNAGHSSTATVSGINIDKTDPVITFGGNAGSYTVGDTINMTCTATDALSGIATADCPEVNATGSSFGPGVHTLEATATDRAGNTTTLATTFEVAMDYDGLCLLVGEYSDSTGVTNSLCAKLRSAEAAAGRGQAQAAANLVNAFKNEVSAQSGKAFTAAEAAELIALADTL
ncbi:MAG: choice-of-anchor K domain-containing protein [Actinomycetota bacterium]